VRRASGKDRYATEAIAQTIEAALAVGRAVSTSFS
jgi:hypothetical protein